MPAPPELQPFLGFRKLTGPARAAMARCLDQDDAFRDRVRDAVGDGELDTAGRLFLDRPSGWSDELEAMATARDEQRRVDEEERRDRSLERELEHAEARLAELDRLARQSAADAGDLRDELGEVRRQRRSLIEDLDAAVARCDAAETAAVDARRRAEEAEAALDVRGRELHDARRRLDELQADLDARPPAPSDATPVVDAGQVARAVTRLRETAAGLDDAITAAAALLPATTMAIDTSAGGPSAAPGRRRPTPLPGGLTDDSAAAARHLLTVPRMVLLVDGYNVSMLAWGDADIADQRIRLVTRLEALASRTGVEPVVVFDGDHGHPAVPGRPRQQVRIRFSAGGVEADDEILDMVDTMAASDPVTVVSNDRRVLDGARSRGANVITSTVLLAVL